MRTDTVFRVSASALKRIYDDVARLDTNASQAFRRRAHALAEAENPRFVVSREDFTRVLKVGVHPNVYAALVKVAKRAGLPCTFIGELVCSFEMDEAA